MVFAIFAHDLLFPSLILLLPAQRITFMGFVGIPPLDILHRTCCILSPPMPTLLQPGSFAWERAYKRGRDKRSIKESPIMQLVGASQRPETQWYSYLSPHDSDGLDRLVCAKYCGVGV